MPLRNGIFALYQGKEYQAVNRGEIQLELVSRDPADLQRGFTVYRPGIFTRRVERADVTQYYSRDTFAAYQGHEFSVIAEEDGRFLLACDRDAFLAERLGFTVTGRLEAEKWVNGTDVERLREHESPLP